METKTITSSKNAYDICERITREQPTTIGETFHSRIAVFVISNQTSKINHVNQQQMRRKNDNLKQNWNSSERKIEDISILFGNLNAREWTHSLSTGCEHTEKRKHFGSANNSNK